jgi:CelD/BcsL family acetyltransferase involved in cellulose biosynthesis
MTEKTGATSAPDLNLKIEVFRSHEPLRTVWTALQDAACSTAFQTYSWISLLLDKVGNALSATPAIVLVSSESGTPLMLIPLAERRHGPMRVLEFVDFGISDYNAHHPQRFRGGTRKAGVLRAMASNSRTDRYGRHGGL